MFLYLKKKEEEANSAHGSAWFLLKLMPPRWDGLVFCTFVLGSTILADLHSCSP
jgi:hypothetical protein